MLQMDNIQTELVNSVASVTYHGHMMHSHGNIMQMAHADSVMQG